MVPKLERLTMRLKIVAAVTFLALFAVTGAFADAVHVVTSTSGCFGSVCSNYSPTASYGGLTFTGASSNTTSNSSGQFWLTLGSVTAASSLPSSWSGSLGLDINFQAPGGIGNFDTAGQIWVTAASNGGSVYIHFNGIYPITFSYHDAQGNLWNGSFNLQLADLSLNAGQTGNLTASGWNASQVDPPATQIVTQTPEPGSLMLFCTGLSGLAFLGPRL